MAIDYVRFQRGSQAAYDALKDAGKLDSNTLYFIYSDDNSSVGALYMGTRIISGGDITIASANLDDLADVIVAGAKTNSFLVKGDNDTWIAKTLEDVITLIQANLDIGTTANPAQVFQVTAEENEDDITVIGNVTADVMLSTGDIVIVKRLIANNKYQHTAYIYDLVLGWTAMDGNYNAETVYFDSNLTITADIGVQTIPASGSLELITAGKNLKQVLDMILAARKLPSKVLPSVTVTSTDSKSYEVGTKITPSFSASFNPGSYTYGPETGLTVTSWKATFNGETLQTNEGTFKEIVIADNTNIRIAVTADYEDGAVPVDNLGELVTDTEELNTCQIKASNAIGYAANYIKGYRNLFYGSKTNPVELNSTNIRALSSKISTTNSVSMNIVEGATQVIVAVPEGRKLTKVADEGAFGTDLLPKMNKITVPVGGADATSDSNGNHVKNYNVYTYTPDTALGANTYTITITNE